MGAFITRKYECEAIGQGKFITLPLLSVRVCVTNNCTFNPLSSNLAIFMKIGVVEVFAFLLHLSAVQILSSLLPVRPGN